MVLEPGASVGPYTVVREIGRGGMGVVYLAHDARLNRDVAIKALPEHLSEDPERLARFEGEARALAQLNHPSVAGIFGLEEVDGQRFLILEYVEGESLSERLERGPLAVDEALDVCMKIAAGLEAAHEAGVIHRDLKPDNVKITPGDQVKVLDFGLAKVSDEASSSFSNPSLTHSPTLTSAGHSPTIPGMIMGTAAYMSPEQARGKRVDKRADVWSFGVVLYECLTGVSPFAGDSVGDSIGAILHKNPDLSLLPAGTPRGVIRVLERCLERDKDNRYRDIGDIRVELMHAASASGVEADAATPTRMRWQGIALAILLATVAARRMVVENASDGRYVNGHVVFMREGALWAVPFDRRRLETTGEPRVVVEGVQHSIHTRTTITETGVGHYAVSASGTLVYSPGSVFPERPTAIVIVDRNGNESKLEIDPRAYLAIRGSADGRSLATTVFYVPESAVWHYDLERQVVRRERGGGSGLWVSWGPGRDEITYDRRGEDGQARLFYKTIGDDPRNETEIELPESPRIWMSEWSRDGTVLIAVDPEKSFLWTYRPGDGWEQLTDYVTRWPTLSPDGNWLAYGSRETSDTTEVLVRPFPEMGPAVQVSRAGGRSPAWSHDGSELFYLMPNPDGTQTVFAAAVSRSGGSLRFGRPVALFSGSYGPAGPNRAWDVLADGRFAFTPTESPDEQRELRNLLYPDRLRIVQNWASTLN